jgi:hypothetical protein
MADRKISDLTALTTPASGDYLPIVDISEVAAASKNKRVTIQSLFQGIPVNVGIGTSIPSGKLNILQDSTANTTPAIRITGSAGDPTNYFLDVVPILSGSTVDYRWDLKSISTNTALLYLSGVGRVGIGTTVVHSLFEVRGTSNGQDIVQLSNSAGSTDGGATNVIRFTCNGNANWGNARYDAFEHIWNTNGSERLRLDSSGRLLVGTSTALTGSNSQYSKGAFIGNSLNSGAGYTAFGRGSSAIGALSDTDIAVINFTDNAAAEFATISCFVDGTVAAGDYPGRLVFSTTADGAASPTERMRITNAGVLQIADAGDITVGTTTGTKIGTATTQKLGFYNATPVVQPTAVADATDAASVITQLNALLTRMRNLGIIAT